MNLSERLTIIRAALSRKPAAQQEAASILSRIVPNVQGDPPERGAYGILEGYAHMPWLHACASKVAQSMAAVEWRLYVTRRGKGAGRKAYRDHGLQRAGMERRKGLIAERANMDELDEVTDHPFIDLLTKGNGYHSGVALRRLESIWMDLVGEAMFLKGRGAVPRFDKRSGVLSSLWPIPPTWIRSIPTPATPYYGISHEGWNENIPASEVLWMHDANPANPYGRGVGLGQAVSDEAETDEYAAKTSRQMFFNRAQPDFLVFPKGERAEMNPNETKRFEQDWLNKLQGYWRSSRPHFLSREVGVYEFQKSMKDLMLTEIRNQERDIILQVWGLPPEKLGLTTGSNRATIEGADLIYSKDVLVPRLEFRRDVFQRLVEEEYGVELIVDYVTPVMEDKEFALRVATAAPWTMDANEWRAVMGLAEKEEFEGVYFVPPSVTPMSAEQLTTDAGPLDLGPVDETPAPEV